MKTKSLLRFCVALALASTATGWLRADQTKEENAIRKSGMAYVEAFNNRDAKAVAALWTPDAVYMNPKTGEAVVGRQEIEKQLVEIFAESKDAKLEVTVDSLQFVSPSVAVEEGTASVLRPGAEPDVTVYSAVYIKSGGDWLLDRMSEAAPTIAYSNFEHLKDLQWLIGSWVDQDDHATIESTGSWTKNQNFISQKFSVSVEGETDLAGIQLIGWDPVEQTIRSWVFDSDGGFGTSTWKQKGNKWIVTAAATLPDGRRASATRTFTLIDDKSITWQISGRALDGEILPNIGPIKLTRKSDSE